SGRRSFLRDAGCPAPRPAIPESPTRAALHPPVAVAAGGIALLFGLAPGGVYRAGPVARAAGELLPHRFTLTARCRAAVCFLWHWSVESPPLAVSQHPALWSPDFPPARVRLAPATIQPSLARHLV